MPETDLATALDVVGGVTPYFGLAAVAPEGTGPLRPATALRDRGVAAELFSATKRRLHCDETRVAASSVFLNFSARLFSLALGTAAVGGRCLDLDPDRLSWTDDDGFLVLVDPAPRYGAEVATEVLDRHLDPLAAHWSRLVAPGALWGNAASAAVTAGRLLVADSRVRVGRAEVAPLLDDLFLDPRLAGTLDPATGRRRSCCLYYRAVPGAYCGDCALR